MRPHGSVPPSTSDRPPQSRNGFVGKAASIVLLGVFSLGCQSQIPAEYVLSLGDGWTLTGIDTFTAGVPATVPGTVHTDLLANDLIPDPFWRDNELKLQWVGEEDWRYSTSFTAGSELMEKEQVDLVFHGLDTYAEVRLNGTTVLTADNMFRRWQVEVGGFLLEGANHLEVLFRSPLPPALEARASLPYELPAGNDRGDPPSRVFTRKAAYHYGWDWGPRLITAGIWRPVQLKGWSGGHITDVQIVTDSIRGDRAFLQAVVEVEVTEAEAERRAAANDIPVRLSLSSPADAFPEVAVHFPVTTNRNQVRIPFQIQDPQRWWPTGLGAAHLYTARTELQVGYRTHTVHQRFGIRTVELVTEADPIGESFYFRVNGSPVFMKGANVIPLDHFSPRVQEEDYRRLFEDVARANMNMLRVWGGGIYETDTFYDLADEFGVLIWQDFMFANGMYPGDSAFLASVEAEARDQVRRLRNHPSLALWCGNNEMDEAWHNWGWARSYSTPEDSASVWGSYGAIFHGILPDVVAEGDPGRPYWPSSPSLGWGNLESLTRGDSHYWGVWHGQEPFEVFREKLPRFMSEYGFQAIPVLETVAEFTEEADRFLSNPILLVHQKHPIGNQIITEYMARDYPVPTDFADLVYVSQLLQARGMRMAFEAHRRAMPRTMGTLYWQLNDTWPVISWSGRDYFGRWKALHYAAREAFSPVMVSPVVDGDSVEVWVINDQPDLVRGRLDLQLLRFDGEVLWEDGIDVSAGPNLSSRAWAETLEELPAFDPKQTVMTARFAGAPEARLFFARPKELAVGAPAIRIQVQTPSPEELAGERWLRVILESDYLAKDVFLRLDPEPPLQPHFEDNYLDLLPGRPRSVRLFTDLTAQEAEEALRLKTLAEIPQEGIPAQVSDTNSVVLGALVDPVPQVR